MMTMAMTMLVMMMMMMMMVMMMMMLDDDDDDADDDDDDGDDEHQGSNILFGVCAPVSSLVFYIENAENTPKVNTKTPSRAMSSQRGGMLQPNRPRSM